jgi:hypothetical protein
MKIQMNRVFAVMVAVSILCIASQAAAVGPYFENESSRNGQVQGPNPTWPRPGEPLWSPSTPQFLPKESLKKGDIILRHPKRSDAAEPLPQDGVNAKVDRHIALR